MELRFGVPNRASKLARDFAVRFTLDIVQQKNRPVSGRKFSQRSVECDTIYRTLQIQVFDWTRIEDPGVSLRFVRSAGVQRNRLYVCCAQPHEHNVDGQAVEPRGQGRVSPERGEAEETLQESLLGAIFRFGLLTRDAKTERIHTALMGFIQPCECKLVSQLREPHELLFGEVV